MTAQPPISGNSQYCPFYAVPGEKFVIMSVLSLGLYQIYWLYRNWMAVKYREGTRIRPLWRGYFGPLYLYPLARRVREGALAAGIDVGWRPWVIMLLYLPSIPFGYAESAIFLLGYAGVLPLWLLNRTVWRLHVRCGVNSGHDDYSFWDRIWLVAGPLVLVLATLAFLFPDATLF